MGFNEAWQHTKIYFNCVLKIFKMTSVDKMLSYKIIDLPKQNMFYTKYFSKNVVIFKA